MKPTAFNSEEYPFTANYFKVNGQRLHFLDEGTGFPVLMLHGNPTWSFFYRHLIRALSGKFRCIVPDHIGCGLSDKPQNYPYRLETHIHNISALVQFLGVEKLNLVVHDWGGAIGMGLAVRHPEWINRMVIMNTAAFIDPFIPLRIALCRIPVIGAFAVRRLNLFVRAARFMATAQKGGLKGEALWGFMFPYRSFADRVGVHRFVRDIPLKSGHASYSLLQEIESRLFILQKKKIALVWGCRDFCFTPGFLDRWRKIFPDAAVFPFENAGHYVLEDAGDEAIKRISEFFDQ